MPEVRLAHNIKIIVWSTLAGVLNKHSQRIKGTPDCAAISPLQSDIVLYRIERLMEETSS